MFAVFCTNQVPAGVIGVPAGAEASIICKLVDMSALVYKLGPPRERL